MFTERLENLENRAALISKKLDDLLNYLSKKRDTEGYKSESKYMCIFSEQNNSKLISK